MKVAYIYLGAGLYKDSVYHKITSQIEALNELGATTKGIFFSVLDVNHVEPSANNHVSCVKVRPVVKGWFRSWRERVRFTQSLYQWSKKYSKDYDVLYVRAYRPTFFWLLFLYRCRGKIITEHQTKELEELMALWNENKLGLSPSAILGWLEHNVIPWYQEMFLGRIALMLTQKIVCVTHEIAEYEKKRFLVFKPASYVIGNGINVDDFVAIPPRTFDGKELNLIMSIGGSTNTAWHGLDLLVKSIEAYRGKVQITLFLAGNPEYLGRYENPRVVLLGNLNKKQLHDKMKECHLGIGSMALQRKGLHEASTLKIREYAASGLPFVFAHDDVDVADLVSRGLALKLIPMKVPYMEDILQFAKQLAKNPDSSNEIKQFAKSHLNTSVKMKNLLDVFNTITL